MKIPDSTLSEILDKLDPVEIIGEYVQLKKVGNRYWGLCPFHHEKTPSFTVSPDKGVFYCFGCHKGGGLFNFIMDIESVSFVEAVNILAEKAGVDIKTENTDKRDIVKKALEELYNRVAGSFHYLLMNSSPAKMFLKYLLDRGINSDTIKKFKLGYAPSDARWLFGFLTKKNYGKDFLKKSGLFFERNNEFLSLFYNRIIFPILNIHGAVVAFGGRTLKENVSKYINSPETLIFHKKDNLFGIYNAIKDIRQKKEFILVEGYMDVLAMHQAGLINTVAPLGTAFTSSQAARLKRYADRGIIAFDSDSAGAEATVRAINILEKEGTQTSVANFKEAKDPAEILQKVGEIKLKKIEEYTINSFQYLLNRAAIRHNGKTPEGKSEIAKELFPYIAESDSQVRKDGFLKELSDYLDISYNSILFDFTEWQTKSLRTVRYPAKSKKDVKEENPQEGNAIDLHSNELFLIIAVVLNRDYFTYLRNELSQDDFENLFAKQIFIALEESYRNEETSLESLFSRINNSKLEELILEKASSDEFTMNIDKLIHDGIIIIKRNSLEKKRKKIVKMLKQNNSIKEDNNSRTLLEEKMHLDNELEKLKVR